MPYIPKMWELYYTVTESSEIKTRTNNLNKEDIFNIMSGNCYHTEIEAQDDAFIQLRRLDKAREGLNEDFIKRFSKHLDRAI